MSGQPGQVIARMPEVNLGELVAKLQQELESANEKLKEFETPREFISTFELDLYKKYSNLIKTAEGYCVWVRGGLRDQLETTDPKKFARCKYNTWVDIYHERSMSTKTAKQEFTRALIRSCVLSVYQSNKNKFVDIQEYHIALREIGITTENMDVMMTLVDAGVKATFKTMVEVS